MPEVPDAQQPVQPIIRRRRQLAGRPRAVDPDDDAQMDPEDLEAADQEVNGPADNDQQDDEQPAAPPANAPAEARAQRNRRWPERLRNYVTY